VIGARVDLDLSPAEGLRVSGLQRATKVGLNRAASPVKATVVSHAQAVARFAFLAKSIRIRTRVYPADRFVAVIGPSRSYQRFKGTYTRGPRAGQRRRHVPANYAHLVESGTRRSVARPWLRPAHAAAAPRFLAQVSAEIRAEVGRELARRGR
jgi:hypothetical protein